MEDLRPQKFYICVGLPGSGKSTWAKKMVKEDPRGKTVIVSRDSIRGSLYGAYDNYEYSPDREELIKRVALSIIANHIVDEYDFIIDETNTTASKRTFWKEAISSLDVYKEIILVHFTEKTKNLEYRMKSPKGVSKSTWEKVINDMKSKFEPPTVAELTGNKKTIITIDNPFSSKEITSETL